MVRTPTVEDVAQRAGVSRQTVSNVLNTPAIVKPATRARAAGDRRAGLPAARRRPSAAHPPQLHDRHPPGSLCRRGLRGRAGPLRARPHRARERARHAHARLCRPHGRRRDRPARGALGGSEIDAAIITGTFHGDPRTRWLGDAQLPFVAFGRPWGEDDLAAPEHLWVDVDGAAGTRAATEHALGFGSRVAFLGWPTGSGTGDDRERGWREAMAAAGATGPRWTTQEDVARARAVVAGAEADVDAVVCASDSSRSAPSSRRRRDPHGCP